MIEICCGALGALAVLAAYWLGIATGRKYAGTPVTGSTADGDNEKERLLLYAEQRAFEDMLHYNMDTAYGLGDSVALDGVGDGR